MEKKNCREKRNAFNLTSLWSILVKACKKKKGKLSQDHKCNRGCKTFPSCFSKADQPPPTDQVPKQQAEAEQGQMANLEKIEQLTKTVEKQKDNLERQKSLIEKKDALIALQASFIQRQQDLIKGIRACQDLQKQLISNYDEITKSLKQQIREAELSIQNLENTTK